MATASGSSADDAVRESLEKSEQLVSNAYDRDAAFPELRDVLEGSSHRTDVGRLAPVIPGFEVVKTVKLPDALFNQYNYVECKCFMGLFPEIHRAWLTVDNQIFLWNFEDGSDFALYDELDQIITSAALARPRPGVFVDQVQYVLVLATPVKIVMLGVSFANRAGTAGVTFDELRLLPTNLSIASDNVSMLSITSTESGRILMGGSDGCLYELVYQASEGWFRKKISKINHSSGLLSTLISPLWNFTTVDALKELVCDTARGILYTLSDKGIISVFDLGYDCSGMTHIISNNSIFKQAVSKCSSVVDKAQLTILSMHVIPPSESRLLSMVAVTVSGIRLYFSTTHRDERFRAGGNARPKVCDLLYVLPSNAGTLSSGHVHTAVYSFGTLMFADAYRDDEDKLVAVYSDAATVIKNDSRTASETHWTTNIRGRTYALAEAHGSLNQYFHRNELAAQHSEAPRLFYLLTNSAIHVIAKMRPIDEVFRSLTEEELYNTLLNRYGPEQVYSMCLLIACGLVGPNPYTQQLLSRSIDGFRDLGLSDPMFMDLATRAFLLGGKPQVSEGAEPSATTAAPMLGMGRAVQENTFSGAHNGLCLFAARILSAVWKQPIAVAVSVSTAASASTGASLSLKSRLSDMGELERIQLALNRFRNFVSANQAFFAVGPDYRVDVAPRVNPRYVARQWHQNKWSAQAVREDKRSLAAIVALLQRCAETIVVWRMLCRAPFSRVAAAMDDNTKRLLSQLPFKSLCVTSEGRTAVRDAIDALMRACTTDGVGVDAVTKELLEHCPSLFNTDDSLLYRAHELLTLGVAARPAIDGLPYLRDATQIFCRIVQRVEIPRVCAMLLKARFYEGIVDLALLKARENDPHDLALSFANSPADTRAVRDAFKQRMELYSTLTLALDDLFGLPSFSALYKDSPLQLTVTHDELLLRDALSDEERQLIQQRAIDRALGSKDELWHRTLYQWYCQRGMASKLLDLSTPHLEKFLSSHNAVEEDLKWQYYVRHNNFLKAAQILLEMAERVGTDANLNRRVELLSRAISNAKSCGTRGFGVAGGLLHDLEQKLDVARVQQTIVAELQRKLDSFAVGEHEMRTALLELNEQLLNPTTLFKYVSRFLLYESGLTLLHCCGYNDPALVFKYWKDIFTDTLGFPFATVTNAMNFVLLRSTYVSLMFRHAVGDANADQQLQKIANKVVELGSRFFPSELVLPIAELSKELERIFLELKPRLVVVNVNWAVQSLHEVGFPARQLFFVYRDHYKEQKSADTKLHFIAVLECILLMWNDSVKSVNVPTHEKQEYRTLAAEAIIEYITFLQSRKDSDAMLSRFRDMQQSITRL